MLTPINAFNGGEPNASGRKADVPEDSLGGGLELNDDRRLSMSITSASVDLFSDFSLRIFTFFLTTVVMILFLVVVETVASAVMILFLVAVGTVAP